MTRKNSAAADMIARLRARFNGLANRPFPDDSSDDTASQLHAELADFDGYVAGRITTLINGGHLERKDLESDIALGRRLAELASSDRPGSADARIYLDYFRELDALLASAKDLAAGKPGQPERSD